MARMLNLRDVLELVNNGLNDGSFASEQLVREPHQAIFHISPRLGKQLDTTGLQQLLG